MDNINKPDNSTEELEKMNFLAKKQVERVQRDFQYFIEYLPNEFKWYKYDDIKDNQKLDGNIAEIVIPEIQPVGLKMYYDALRDMEDPRHSYIAGSAIETIPKDMSRRNTNQFSFNSLQNTLMSNGQEEDGEFFYISRATQGSQQRYKKLWKEWCDYGHWNDRNHEYGLPDPLSFDWKPVSRDDIKNAIGNSLHTAWKNVQYTVSKNYFEVLSEIRDRVQGMIDACGADVCLGLIDLIPLIDNVLDAGKRVQWDESEGGYLEFDNNLAIELTKKYYLVLLQERIRLEELPIINEYRKAIKKLEYLYRLKKGPKMRLNILNAN